MSKMLNWARRSGQAFRAGVRTQSVGQPVFRRSFGYRSLRIPKRSFAFTTASVPVTIAGFLNLFQKKEEEDESELITTIKRAVLMIQRDEFKVAEQLLHIALKLAQEQQNEDGITYIYDLMANLAFAQGEFSKAEKLFVQTMQRVIGGGAPQDDIKVLHMSLKLAKICEEKQKFEVAKNGQFYEIERDSGMQKAYCTSADQADLNELWFVKIGQELLEELAPQSTSPQHFYAVPRESSEAEVGYEFCVNSLEKKVEQDPEDEDVVTLWAMSLDWYARFLLDKNRLSEAFSYFKKAYNMCLKVNGEIHEQTVVLLNDLGSVSFLKGDHAGAMDYLTKAVEIGKHLPNMNDFSSVYVNLGNVCLQQKMYEEAKRHCKEGFQNATRHNNAEGIQEANLCLEELRKVWKK